MVLKWYTGEVQLTHPSIIENDFLQPLILTRNSIQKLTKRQAPPFQALTPNEPFLHPSWDPDHCDEKERIASAFLGTLELARYAMDSLRANGADDVFQRYFQASSRSSVFKIFRAFMNQQVGSQATVGPANVLFKNARMGYDDPPAGWSQENQGTCENRDDWAYMVNFKTKTSLANIGFLSVCPRAFTRLPVEVDLPLMTATSKDTRRCNDVMEKVYAWEEMRGLTGLLLHEFLHYNVLIASAAADFVGFINPQQSVYLGDFNSEDTQSGCDSPSVSVSHTFCGGSSANAVVRLWVSPHAGHRLYPKVLTLDTRPWNAQRLQKVDGGNPTITLRLPPSLPVKLCHTNIS